MPFIGNQPAKVPLTSADITDGIITNADIANSTINLTTKVTGSLPVANGGTGLTALGTASQVLRVNSGATGLEFGTLASGILQVKQAVQSAVVSTTSTSFVDISGLSVSITPASSSNKILVIADIVFSGTGNGWIMGGITSNFGSTYDSHIFNRTGVFLDNPASTSSLTYTVQGNVPRGNTTFYLNRDADDTSGGPNHPRTASSITVIEIASSILT